MVAEQVGHRDPFFAHKYLGALNPNQQSHQIMFDRIGSKPGCQMRGPTATPQEAIELYNQIIQDNLGSFFFDNSEGNSGYTQGDSKEQDTIDRLAGMAAKEEIEGVMTAYQELVYDLLGEEMRNAERILQVGTGPGILARVVNLFCEQHNPSASSILGDVGVDALPGDINVARTGIQILVQPNTAPKIDSEGNTVGDGVNVVTVIDLDKPMPACLTAEGQSDVLFLDQSAVYTHDQSTFLARITNSLDALKDGGTMIVTGLREHTKAEYMAQQVQELRRMLIRLAGKSFVTGSDGRLPSRGDYLRRKVKAYGVAKAGKTRLQGRQLPQSEVEEALNSLVEQDRISMEQFTLQGGLIYGYKIVK